MPLLGLEAESVRPLAIRGQNTMEPLIGQHSDLKDVL